MQSEKKVSTSDKQSKKPQIINDLRKAVENLEDRVKTFEVGSLNMEEFQEKISDGIDALRPKTDDLQRNVDKFVQNTEKRASDIYTRMLGRFGIASLKDVDGVRRSMDRLRRRVVGLERNSKGATAKKKSRSSK